MSLITRCPACRTMFKVVPDQLRISDGWVRCGKCEEIFDASAHMQGTELRTNEASSDDSPETVPFDHELATAMASEERPQHTPAKSARQSADQREPRTEVDFEIREPASTAVSVMEPTVATEHLLQPGGGHSTVAKKEPALSGEPIVPAEAVADESKPVDAGTELSFMRDANRAFAWHRPVVRALLMVLGLFLLLGLGVQLLVHERDRVVALEPGLRFLVEELCTPLDCRIEPLRQIESIVIDSSAFSKVKGDVYKLSVTLKNNAPIDLAMPAIELSLTDTLDTPLLRRVLKPADLGNKTGVMPAASEIQTTLVLTIKTNGNTERVAGYRLLAFYP